MQSRLPLAVYDRAMTAAARLGISVSAYLELLIARDPIDASGRPLWDPPPPLGATANPAPGLELSA